MFSDDVQEVLAEELQSRTVRVLHDTGPIFDLIEQCFPVGPNRIAWEKVKDKRHCEVFPLDAGELHASEVATKLEALRQQVSRWLKDAGVDWGERVAWVGDETDIGAEMTAGCAMDHYPKLFSFPQHAYIVSTDGDWCLNYVMEGELFFAKAVK